jgi:hypothetical protein
VVVITPVFSGARPLCLSLAAEVHHLLHKLTAHIHDLLEVIFVDTYLLAF